MLEKDIVRNYLSKPFHFEFHKLYLISASKNWPWKTNVTRSTQGTISWRLKNGQLLKHKVLFVLVFFNRTSLQALILLQKEY